jgi:hypothetical protein
MSKQVVMFTREQYLRAKLEYLTARAIVRYREEQAELLRMWEEFEARRGGIRQAGEKKP